jgi:DNA (cytosine-5)-methyltransferase 1
MKRVRGVGFVHQVLEELNVAGFDAEIHRLLACDFGVPQRRLRYLYLAQLKGLSGAPGQPVPTHCSDGPLCGCGLPVAPTVLEAFKGAFADGTPLPGADGRALPSFGPGEEAEYRPDHWPGDGGQEGPPLLNASTMRHSEKVVDRIREIKPGKGPISYRRLEADLARTLVAGHRAMPVHPEQDRTIKEVRPFR